MMHRDLAPLRFVRYGRRVRERLKKLRETKAERGIAQPIYGRDVTKHDRDAR